ncbi:unnamed protein product [Angiostrongylus costaricensis]|uniref:Peptidase S1 domain-containing protein n=1 Tax=Angiostrongylus costaricensis TaxID=334426 RepID=A0A0R3PPT1_ANGCS|nr:unnamed protein product [Angiostrongylus costaricensis]
MTKVMICTYNARTLAYESSTEELIMPARIYHNVIGLVQTRRRHPLNAVYDTGEELFLGTCDSKEVDGVGVLVNKSLFMTSIIRTTNNPNRTFTIEKMWTNTGFDILRRLCADIKL